MDRDMKLLFCRQILDCIFNDLINLCRRYFIGWSHGAEPLFVVKEGRTFSAFDLNAALTPMLIKPGNLSHGVHECCAYIFIGSFVKVVEPLDKNFGNFSFNIFSYSIPFIRTARRKIIFTAIVSI